MTTSKNKNRIVGTGKTVDLAVKTSGVEDGEQAEFEIFKQADHSSLDTVSGKVVRAKATTTWTAKGPEAEDKEQEWPLYYKVRCKGLETKATRLTVYTDWVEITSVDKDEKSMPEAKYRLKSGTSDRPGDTGKKGVATEKELAYGDVTIDWIEPYELIEWVDEEGPKRKAKLRRSLKAKLLWPEAGEHIQYVNLKEDAKQKEFGHKIKVQVTLEEGKKDDIVYVRGKWNDKNSKRNSPKPEIVGASKQDWAPDGGKEYKLDKNADADGKAEVEIELGQAGGDEVALEFSGSEKFEKKKTVTLKITNWRRVYYQITKPKGRTLHSFDACEKALKKAFIEYEHLKTVEIEEKEPPKGSWIAGREFGQKGMVLNIGSGNREWFWKKIDKEVEKNPLGAHLIFCDQQYDSAEAQTIEGEVNSKKGGTFPIKSPDDYDLFETSIKTGETSVLDGSTWTSKAPGGHPHSGKSGKITKEMVDIHHKKRPDKVRVVFQQGQEPYDMVGDGKPPKGKKATDAETKHPIKVKLKLDVAEGPFLGESEKQHQLLVIVPNKASFNATLVHELGHALYQTLKRTAPGTSKGDHDRTYTGKGHSGHHCAYGLKSDQYGKADYSEEKFEGRCVMWGEGSGTKAPKGKTFCQLCLPFVLAEACDAFDKS